VTRLGLWAQPIQPDASVSLAFGAHATGTVAFSVEQDQLKFITLSGGYDPATTVTLASAAWTAPAPGWMRVEVTRTSAREAVGRVFDERGALLAELPATGLPLTGQGIGFSAPHAAIDAFSGCGPHQRPSDRFAPLWSTFSGDAQRTGQHAVDVMMPGLPTEVWRLDLRDLSHTVPSCPVGSADEVVYSSPVISGDGRLFVGSQMPCFTANPGEGWLYGVDACTGDLLWERDMHGWIESSPSVSHDNKAVYIGSKSGRVEAVDAATGDLLWAYTTSDAITSSPVLDREGNLYIGSLDGALYSLDPQGQLRWRVQAPPSAAMHTSPALSLDEQTVYTAYTQSCGGPFGGSSCPTIPFALWAIDATTGVVSWSFDLAHPVWGSPAVDPVHGNIVFADFAISGDSHVYSVSPQGQENWRQPIQSYSNGVPSFGLDGSVYVGAYAGAGVQGTLYAFESDGQPRWSFTLPGGNVNVQSSPTLVHQGQTVLFGTYGAPGSGADGGVYAVDTTTGQLQWRFLTDIMVQSTVAVTADGRAFFGDWDGLIHGVGSIQSPLCQ